MSFAPLLLWSQTLSFCSKGFAASLAFSIQLHKELCDFIMPRKGLIEGQFSRYFSVGNFLSVMDKLGKKSLMLTNLLYKVQETIYEEPSVMSHSNQHSFQGSWGLLTTLLQNKTSLPLSSFWLKLMYTEVKRNEN